MRYVLANLILGAALLFGQAPSGRVETLLLPHALRPGENAWLEVQLGAIAHGAEVEIVTTSGQLLGVISPYGVRAGASAGTYTVPVPRAAISKRSLSVRISIRFYHSMRAPTLQEVKRPRIRITSAAEAH